MVNEQAAISEQETAIETVTVPASGIEAYLRRDHYAGDVLVATDFQVTVTMPDGRILKNPRGWTATPLELVEGENTITICYDINRWIMEIAEETAVICIFGR